MVKEILPSPKTDHYRNRMDFVIDFEGRVGMRQKGKWWRVIDGHTCFLANERIDALFSLVRKWVHTSGLSYFDRKAHTGLLRYAVIRATLAGDTMINIVTSGPHHAQENRDTIVNALVDLQEETNPTTLIWSVNHTITDVSYGDDLTVMSGPGAIIEEINGYQYRISPNAFFQTNSHAAPLLQDTVQEFAGDLTNKILLDLYCGSGFFSIMLSAQTKRTIGIEMNEQAVEDAKKNATRNNSTAEFVLQKTEGADWGTYNPDIVILDPPRSGMHDKALADLMRIKPRTIIYVSCNPKNFAREMIQLQEYYEVSNMRAIDMFPHTPHVELVTRLDLKN